MRRFLPVLAAFFAPAALMAAVDVTSYDSCLARVKENPEQAYDAALNWRDFGAGGAAAKHCAALALVASGRYEEAASQLEALARDPAAGDREARAEILAQAGNAWLLEHKPARAYDAFSRALKLAPLSSQALIDRARALVVLDREREAEQDLSSAIAVNPLATEAFVLRASVKRARLDLDGARKDADEAVRLEPDNAEALLERGLVRAQQDDHQGALSDWRAALAQGGQSPAGREAQRLLEEAALREKARPLSQAPESKGVP